MQLVSLKLDSMNWNALNVIMIGYFLKGLTKIEIYHLKIFINVLKMQEIFLNAVKYKKKEDIYFVVFFDEELSMYIAM